jgi:ferredoxin
MPKLTVDGRTPDVPEGQRLVLAMESQGVPIGHRCGGFARCTTCRVEFQTGEPDTMITICRCTESDVAELAKESSS